MECTTLESYDENGQMKMRPKKQFDTLDGAIAVAKIENAKPHHIHKVVAYKCKTCFKYHIGRNGKEIKEKDKKKLQQMFSDKLALEKKRKENPNFKVVGYIDLSTIRY